MQKRRILLAALVAVTCLPLSAQSDDFGLWGEVNVEKKLTKKWSLGAGVEYRTRDNVKTSDRFSAGIDASYKITDWLKASVGYSLLDDHNYKVNTKGTKYADYWGLRHRTSMSLTAAKSFGKFNLSLRERWQYTFRPEKTVTRYYLNTTTSHDAGEEADEKTYSSKHKHVWRNRLQVRYKISSMWHPYVNAETYMSSSFEKIRCAAGTEIRINKQHSLNVAYMFQHPFNDDEDEGNSHILNVGYTFKF